MNKFGVVSKHYIDGKCLQKEHANAKLDCYQVFIESVGLEAGTIYKYPRRPITDSQRSDIKQDVFFT